jgi:hypothetical protein
VLEVSPGGAAGHRPAPVLEGVVPAGDQRPQ